MGAGETNVQERQRPLRRHYRQVPAAAWITDRARTASAPGAEPGQGRLVLGEDGTGRWRFSVHRALGGDHDAPNPGDLLCGALAACQDSTLRMIANRLALSLEAVAVEVTAEVDVRGTLAVERTVPVGFQRMTCRVHFRAPKGTDPGLIEQLCLATERSCMVLQTLQQAIDVRVRYDVGT